jgi:tetratricopeptide (TPR) repeat protein
MLLKQSLVILLALFSAPVWSNPAPWVGSSFDGNACTGKGQGYGPYDYSQRSSIDPHHLNIVEGAHFTPEVENLVKGNRGTIEEDIDYTLRAWPNHPRALLSIIHYQLNIKNKLMQGKLTSPPECYLQRAIHFSPKDATSYSLYAFYLRKMSRLDEAAKFYRHAIKLAPNNAKIEYSYSWLLIDLKQYEEAVKYAKLAYQHGNPPGKLKDKLEKLGVWN